MKSVFVICSLLGVTIGSLLLTVNGVPVTSKDASNPAVSNNSAAAVTVNKDDTNISKTPSSETTIPIPPVHTASASDPGEVTLKPTTAGTKTTTANGTKHPDTTTAISPTTKPDTTTATTPTTSTTSTTTTTTTTKKITTISSTPPTTASPTATVVTTALPSGSPSSKDRHFDGLSFFGGIILATCLMAAAAFSWKFYRQCSERHYRTL